MRLADLEEEETVGLHEPGIRDAAFGVSETLRNPRRLDVFGLSGVQPKTANLPIFRPGVLPILATSGAKFDAGIAMTHSFLARRAETL
jgi:hypothetical protein